MENVPSGICGQAQISLRRCLRIRAVWSAPSLSANRIIATDEWRAKTRMILCACAGWSKSAHFAHFWRHFFTWRDPNYGDVLRTFPVKSIWHIVLKGTLWKPGTHQWITQVLHNFLSTNLERKSSIARTPRARLSWLIRTCIWVPTKLFL